jgi:hypothetical protein
MLLRTEETPSGLDISDWRARMDMLFERVYRQRRSILAASLIADQEICRDLALVFYYGHVFGQLVEVYRP